MVLKCSSCLFLQMCSFVRFSAQKPVLGLGLGLGLGLRVGAPWKGSRRRSLCRKHARHGRPARPKGLIGRGGPHLGAAPGSFWPSPSSSPGPLLALVSGEAGSAPLWAIAHWARIGPKGCWGIGLPGPGSGVPCLGQRQAPLNMPKKSPVNLALVPAGSALRLRGQRQWNRRVWHALPAAP